MRIKKPITEAFTPITGEPTPAPMKKLRGRKPPPAAVHQDPLKELRRLVREHQNNTRTKVRLLLMRTDRTIRDRDTGKTIEVQKNTLPEDVRADLKIVAERISARNAELARAMTIELKTVPIYTHFLSKVFGCGPIVSAYLCSMIKIERAAKVSNLRRYCGWACDANGKLERRSGGPKYDPSGNFTAGAAGAYNADLRTCIWQMFCSMWKTSAKKSVDAPHGKTTKYLRRWREAKQGRASTGRAKGSHAAGQHKAADLFVEDLYTVWRALEGLDVWPSYHAAKLGYSHGGKVCVDEPRKLSLEEALAVVGDVGGVPLAEPAVDLGDAELAKLLSEDGVAAE